MTEKTQCFCCGVELSTEDGTIFSPAGHIPILTYPIFKLLVSPAISTMFADAYSKVDWEDVFKNQH